MSNFIEKLQESLGIAANTGLEQCVRMGWVAGVGMWFQRCSNGSFIFFQVDTPKFSGQ